MNGITFRDAIDNNKRKILEYLKDKKASSLTSTRSICEYYSGEREMPSVRKALNELRKEGKVTTDDKKHFWEGKHWQLTGDELTLKTE